jgi:hypothetical protein
MSPEEWARTRQLLIGIIQDPGSDKERVKSAFHCLRVMTDKERTYALFPDIVRSIEESHPDVAAAVIALLPERFVYKENVPRVA